MCKGRLTMQNWKIKTKMTLRILSHTYKTALENHKYTLAVFSEFWDLGFRGSFTYFGLYLQTHYVISLKVQAVLLVLKNTALRIGSACR